MVICGLFSWTLAVMRIQFHNLFFFWKLQYSMRTLYTRQNRSNGLQKRLGDIKRTPLREVSNFIIAFRRKTSEIVFVRNINPHRLLFQPVIVHFGYLWLQHFEPEHAALVKGTCFSICLAQLYSILLDFQIIVAMAEKLGSLTTFLSHGRQPEVNILQAGTYVSPRFSK